MIWRYQLNRRASIRIRNIKIMENGLIQRENKFKFLEGNIDWGNITIYFSQTTYRTEMISHSAD